MTGCLHCRDGTAWDSRGIPVPCGCGEDEGPRCECGALTWWDGDEWTCDLDDEEECRA